MEEVTEREREVTSALPRNVAGISRSPEHLALSSRAHIVVGFPSAGADSAVLTRSTLEVF
jgi:hypothetical protein